MFIYMVTKQCWDLKHVNSNKDKNNASLFTFKTMLWAPTIFMYIIVN